MAAQDLCVLATVKAWLDIGTADTSKDAILSLLITSCSTIIEQWCGRNFYSATYTENYNGTGTTRLILNQLPIQSVASVTINDQVIPVSTDPLVYGYMFDVNSIYLVGSAMPSLGLSTGSNVSGNNRFPMGNQNVAVEYTAGYATIPAAINQAAVDFVAYKFRERSRIGMRSDHIGVSAQGSSYNIDGLPDMVKAAIMPFKRFAPKL